MLSRDVISRAIDHPAAAILNTRTAIITHTPWLPDGVQRGDVLHIGVGQLEMSLRYRPAREAQLVTGRREAQFPTPGVLGWDNAGGRGGVPPPRRDRLARVDSFSAYPDRTSHEQNSPVTDDDAYWDALPDTLTPTTVAKILNVGKPAVLSRLRSGVIPGYQIRASWILFKAEIRAWLASTSNQAPPGPPAPVDVLAAYGDEMTYRDLMALFGKTKQTIYIWLHEGEIPAFHVGNRWVIHKPQLRQRLREISNQNDRTP